MPYEETPYEVTYARVEKVKDMKNKFELILDEEEVRSSEKTGYAIPRFSEYKKSMVEALVQESIFELEKIENYVEKDLLHLTKGFLSTLSCMTDPKRCDSWKNHSFEFKDKLRKNKELIKAFDLKSDIALKNSPFRKRLPHATLTIEDETPYAFVEGELENDICLGIMVYPKSEDVRQRFVYTVRTLTQITSSLTPTRSWSNKDIDYFNGQTDLGIHEEWIYEIKSLGHSLTYLVNCSSWVENELFPFDLGELQVKTGYNYLDDTQSS